ncbi:unnamed protein product [Linum tenue]|uniref:AMP-dependent synthetase/ligase domain-containing protein n=1 Tax=Linum tenue TaxID=586396 RepID=A0AAV0R103_9ROSI|nr:unnamed protein product [Linum tenue]
MDESSAQRRLDTVQSHLLLGGGDGDDDHSLRLQPNFTASLQFVNSHTYSVNLPEKLQTGKWNVYRSVRSPLKLLSRFPDHPEIGTLHDNFQHAVESYRDYKYLGTRIRQDGKIGDYMWMTYGEAATAREAIGSGLRYHGLDKGACVGAYFINRPEWLIVDHACAAYSYISVPLYDTLGPDAVKFVVNHADVQAIFCTPETLNTVVGGVDENLPSLPSSGVKLISYLKLIGEGRSSLQPFIPPKPEDVATICYTSGTTGTPKGVVLTHGNLIASVAGSSLSIKFNCSDISEELPTGNATTAEEQPSVVQVDSDGDLERRAEQPDVEEVLVIEPPATEETLSSVEQKKGAEQKLWPRTGDDSAIIASSGLKSLTKEPPPSTEVITTIPVPTTKKPTMDVGRTRSLNDFHDTLPSIVAMDPKNQTERGPNQHSIGDAVIPRLRVTSPPWPPPGEFLSASEQEATEKLTASLVDGETERDAEPRSAVGVPGHTAKSRQPSFLVVTPKVREDELTTRSAVLVRVLPGQIDTWKCRMTWGLIIGQSVQSGIDQQAVGCSKPTREQGYGPVEIRFDVKATTALKMSRWKDGVSQLHRGPAVPSRLEYLNCFSICFVYIYNWNFGDKVTEEEGMNRLEPRGNEPPKLSFSPLICGFGNKLGKEILVKTLLDWLYGDQGHLIIGWDLPRTQVWANSVLVDLNYSGCMCHPQFVKLATRWDEEVMSLGEEFSKRAIEKRLEQQHKAGGYDLRISGNGTILHWSFGIAAPEPLISVPWDTQLVGGNITCWQLLFFGCTWKGDPACLARVPLVGLFEPNCLDFSSWQLSLVRGAGSETFEVLLDGRSGDGDVGQEATNGADIKKARWMQGMWKWEDGRGCMRGVEGRLYPSLCEERGAGRSVQWKLGLIFITTSAAEDSLKLMDDLAALRPTIFCSVPRLYNRIYDGITAAVKTSGALKEKLFNAAFNSKKQAIMSGRTPSPMWDRLVFNKIKAKLGGRVRLMGSGASPLSPDVMDFLRVCFGCQVLEGYGMTETSCIISIMDEGDNLSGHVGSPNPACEVKLVDVPEMNYTSEDQPFPRGEICVRGPTIFQGYYKDQTQTGEVIDEDGWLHTGDIGLWLDGGRLKIVDRKKNIFKLTQGEYIAPEKIENVYTKSRFVGQCFVSGDSFNSSLVAIVSVDPDVLTEWATSQGIKADDLGRLCNDLRARAAVLADMDSIGREAQLRGFEFAKAVTLVPEPFTLENGLLTPTFKIKRPQAKEYFAKAITDMYDELSASEHQTPTSKL